ncbi:MAG: acetate--CoA ligase family protein [Chloroflexi bacterium]|nr:acetate--CoA ligase family protein [Chloroflexota bacterium]
MSSLTPHAGGPSSAATALPAAEGRAWLRARLPAALHALVAIPHAETSADDASAPACWTSSPPAHAFAVYLWREPIFGLTLAVGASGPLGVLLDEVSVRMLPLAEADAHEMLSELAASRLLEGLRGAPPGDRDALVRLLLAVGGPDGLATRADDLAGLILDPVVVHSRGVTVAGVRVTLGVGMPTAESADGADAAETGSRTAERVQADAAAETATAAGGAPLPAFVPGRVLLVGRADGEAASCAEAIEPALAKGGPLALVAQRADIALEIVRRAGTLGLRFGTVVAAGEPIDLDPSDYLAHQADDAATRAVALYIERLVDGQRLPRALAEVAARKPVIVLTAGVRRANGPAAADWATDAERTCDRSAPAIGSEAVWTAALRQANAIAVRAVEELVDTMQMLHRVPPPQGRGVCLFGNGGGATVTATDACARAGLVVPPFDPVTEEALLALGIPPGTSVKNPIDAPGNTLRRDEGGMLEPLLRIAMRDPHVHALIVHLNLQTLSWLGSPARARLLISRMVEAVCAVGGRDKPLLLALRSSGEPELEDLRRREEAKAMAAGIPVYPSLPAACQTLGRVVAWYERVRARRGVAG